MLFVRAQQFASDLIVDDLGDDEPISRGQVGFGPFSGLLRGTGGCRVAQQTERPAVKD